MRGVIVTEAGLVVYIFGYSVVVYLVLVVIGSNVACVVKSKCSVFTRTEDKTESTAILYVRDYL